MVTKKIQENLLVLFIDEKPLNNQSNSFIEFSNQINLQSYQSTSKLKMLQLKGDHQHTDAKISKNTFEILSSKKSVSTMEINKK